MFIRYDTTGRIFGTCWQDPQDGLYLETSATVNPSRHYVNNGQLCLAPEPPNATCMFDYDIKQWVDPRTLAEIKATKWSEIKQARSQAEYGGFVWDGSTFDSDATSQGRITGAVTLAQMSSTFEINWILADNTVRTLGQIEMLQVGGALGEYVATQFAIGAYLRGLIDGATTIAEVEAITWPST